LQSPVLVQTPFCEEEKSDSLTVDKVTWHNSSGKNGSSDKDICFWCIPPCQFFLQSVFLDENDPFMAGLFDGRIFEV